jgi:hypothetical protein
MLCAGRIVLRFTPQSYDAVLELLSCREVETPKAPLNIEIRQEDSTRKAAAKRQPGSTRPYQTSRTEASLDGLGLDVVGVRVKAACPIYKLPAFFYWVVLWWAMSATAVARSSATTTESQHFDQLKLVVRSVIITNDIRLSKPCSGYLKQGDDEQCLCIENGTKSTPLKPCCQNTPALLGIMPTCHPSLRDYCSANPLIPLEVGG